MILKKIEDISNNFKSNVFNVLIPQITEKINKGEIKIEYSLDEIRRILEINYKIENLNMRLRNILSDSEIGISVKEHKFVFFRKMYGINRESDLFKVKFEKNISTITAEINKKNKLVIEENCFKSFFDIDYNINNIYQRIRNILSSTNLRVKIEKNIFIEGKNTNLLIFYDKNKTYIFDKEFEKIDNDIEKHPIIIEEPNNKIIEPTNEIEKSEIDIKLSLEIFKNEEIKKLNEYCEKLTKDLPYNIPFPYTIVCKSCKNKVILEYLETKCPICDDIILEWES